MIIHSKPCLKLDKSSDQHALLQVWQWSGCAALHKVEHAYSIGKVVDWKVNGWFLQKQYDHTVSCFGLFTRWFSTDHMFDLPENDVNTRCKLCDCDTIWGCIYAKTFLIRLPNSWTAWHRDRICNQINSWSHRTNLWKLLFTDKWEWYHVITYREVISICQQMIQ